MNIYLIKAYILICCLSSSFIYSQNFTNKINCQITFMPLLHKDLSSTLIPYTAKYRYYVTESKKDPSELELLAIIYSYLTKNSTPEENLKRSLNGYWNKILDTFWNHHHQRSHAISYNEMLNLVAENSITPLNQDEFESEKLALLQNTYKDLLMLLAYNKNMNQYETYHLTCSDGTSRSLDISEIKELSFIKNYHVWSSESEENNYFFNIFRSHLDFFIYLKNSTQSPQITQKINDFLNKL